ncbi:hypothetical protein FHT76_005776 [Rhizobium sp. BK176]|nr:hypothetical protein [Rhizobium sp. BK181]MCS4094076.1 hypothetical protein [Rhizobium sp. BK176]
MTSSSLRHRLVVLPPFLWALNTQLGLLLPYRDCQLGTDWTLLAALAIVAISIATTIALRRRATSRIGIFGSRSEVLLGMSFTFALILQGAAAVLLDPCVH